MKTTDIIEGHTYRGHKGSPKKVLKIEDGVRRGEPCQWVTFLYVYGIGIYSTEPAAHTLRGFASWAITDVTEVPK